jgi:NitT/TauT family transport system substrate-binding protein
MIRRRAFLRGLGAAGVLGLTARKADAQAPPETTRIRLPYTAAICIAPQYLARELLKLEGFSDVQYVALKDLAAFYPAIGAGDIDVGIGFLPLHLINQDAGLPIVQLAPVHAGCFELTGAGRVRAIRDLKGARVGVLGLQTAHYYFLSSIAAYVGIDPQKEIEWVTHSLADSTTVLSTGKVDAVMAFPPVPQELRAKKIGHSVFNSSVDRPWAHYFCCTVIANRKFVERNPVAARRAIRAILKSTDVCALEPERAARTIVEQGFASNYDYALATMREVPYHRWREYDPVDAVRFYALRLRELGFVKSNPQKLISEGTDWRSFNELKKELKG